MGLEHAFVTFLQNQTSLMALINQILKNLTYSAALLPVEPLILCRRVKGRERSLRGQPQRRMCRNMPECLHPVIAVLLIVQCKHGAEEDSPVCPCPHNPLLQTLTQGKRASHQGCLAAIRWEGDSVSQPIQLGPLYRTSALGFNLLQQGNNMLDIDIQINLTFLI